MNFFEQQDKTRKKTSRLVLYFILAIIFIILAVDLLIVCTIIYSSYPDSSNSIHFMLNNEETTLIKQGSIDFRVFSLLMLMVTAGVAPVILIIIGIGTLIRLIQTRGGGLSVAEMVKARPIDHSTEDFKEKRFINIVEEMSIASGVSVPSLFVMDNEPAINAFVAGVHPNDMVMVVTQGALELLDRDALQGVVGHEFSHIFNGDMRINLRLIGLLGGIFAIGQLGSFILRSLQFRTSSSSSDSKGSGVFVVIIIGIGLFVIGYIGLFFGRLIKAAISRQRESLADACSVQYTRNPQGLINALSAIQENQKGSQLKSSHAEDVNHMCFGPSLNMWFGALLASHPPIAQRIHDLDPQARYSRDIQPNSVSSNTPSSFSPHGEAMGFASTSSSINQIEQSIGHLNQEHIEYATKLLDGIPEEIKNLCHDSNQVEIILYAVLMPTHDRILNAQAEDLINKQLDTASISQIRHYGQQIDALGAMYYLPIIDIAIPAFRLKNMDEKIKVIAILEQFVAINPNLFTFSAVAVIKKSINLYATPKKHIRLASLIPQVSELIRFIIACGKTDAQTSSALFQQVMQQFTKGQINEPPAKVFSAQGFQDMVAKLNQLAPLDKEKLLHACLSCIEIDQRIEIEETEAVRAIAACLNCPIPPIMPSTD